jgi:transcriptional regulator with XRE-family HTH domain
MGKRGRPQKPRTSELGRYIEQLRLEHRWSIKRLAQEARVSYRTLSKLELGRSLPRHPENFLLKVAKAFDTHPDQLLLRASLTPMLRPSHIEISLSAPRTIALTVLVTEEERSSHQGDTYFVLTASSEAVMPETAPYRRFIDLMQDADAVVLELAATYDMFRTMNSDHEDALIRLRRKKGSKCDNGNDKKALKLLRELGLPTS